MMEKGLAAVVFPGQGSQRPGMGKDFYDQISVSRQAYEEASDALGWDVAALCFDEDEDDLNLTAFCQPCILTTEIAMLRGLAECYGFYPSFFGGHSLGEFTALVAAEAMPLADAVRIVHRRGQLMQEAMPPGRGTMAAVISDHLDSERLGRHLQDLPVDVANVNSDSQVVLSGVSESMPDAAVRVQESLADGQFFRFVPLNVSAPFHSRFMQPVEMQFQEILRDAGKNFSTHNAPNVTSNFTGNFHGDRPQGIINSLVRQISNVVRWKDNMQRLVAKTNLIFEVGPGRPLRDFFKTLNVNCLSITNLRAAERIL
jgi:[acyl-carrier-protein] S-malonyltransferase/trans-AT polyketide synthase/acyltransferase/oxidoreductase domain-containing protein